MLKKILALLAMLYAAAAFAAVDVNTATATELDGVKGIGPVMSRRILQERKKGEFKNWDDLIARVKGIAPVLAARYSHAGLTVGGQGYKRMDGPAKSDKKDEKAARKDDKAAAAKPAASARK